MTELHSRIGIHTPEVWHDHLATTLDRDTSCRVVIVDGLLRIMYMNDAATAAMNRPTQSDTFHSLFIEPIGMERAELVDEVFQTNRTILIDGVVDGEGVRMTMQRIEADDGQHHAVLVIIRPLASIPWENEGHDRTPVTIARRHSIGVLARLSPRELQVLALLAQGHSTGEIADMFHRSKRTVDCHRASISGKLDDAGMPELTVLALRAGLIRCGLSYDPCQGDELHIYRRLLSRILEVRRSPHCGLVLGATA